MMNLIPDMTADEARQAVKALQAEMAMVAAANNAKAKHRGPAFRSPSIALAYLCGIGPCALASLAR